MQGNTLYILRGVSGSGKSTLATTLVNSLHHAKAVSADDFFEHEGAYVFDANLLGQAHAQCRQRVDKMMDLQFSNIILHNTNTSEKEIEPYLNLADHYGYKVISLVVENRHGNSSVHNVPDNTLHKQRRRLLDSIKLA
mgnify:CR=1 FL=1